MCSSKKLIFPYSYGVIVFSGDTYSFWIHELKVFHFNFILFVIVLRVFDGVTKERLSQFFFEFVMTCTYSV